MSARRGRSRSGTFAPAAERLKGDADAEAKVVEILARAATELKNS